MDSYTFTIKFEMILINIAKNNKVPNEFKIFYMLKIKIKLVRNRSPELAMCIAVHVNRKAAITRCLRRHLPGIVHKVLTTVLLLDYAPAAFPFRYSFFPCSFSLCVARDRLPEGLRDPPPSCTPPCI